MPERKPKPLAEYGPFYGMRYAYDPTDNGENAGFVYEALNMVPADPVRGGAYLRRPADQRVTVVASNVLPQWLGVLKARSGYITVGIFAGEIWTLSGTPNATWTKQVTTANLTTAGVTLSATVVCYAVSYNNTLVIHDGTNQPFTWDGTGGSGGLTLLTNAPSKVYGVPTVYYGKLFFIKDVAASSADRSTIVWSEENAANTGYEAGGYSNAWTLQQSGSGALYAIRGTNEGLCYFRAQGIGVIRGAVSPSFSNDGVHDGISQHHGTTNPFGVAYTAGRMYFLQTQTGEPHVIVSGRPIALGEDIQDLIGNGRYQTSALGGTAGRIVPFPYLKAIAIGYNLAGSRSQGLGGNESIIFLYSTETQRCIGRMTQAQIVTNVGSFPDFDAVPAMGECFHGSASISGLIVAVQGATTYTYSCPPLGNTSGDTLYNATNQPSTFRLTLAPYQAPTDKVADVHEVETHLDAINVGGAASGTTLTIAARQTNTALTGGATTDIGSITSIVPDSVYRREFRGLIGVNQQWRNLQLTIRDSGTLRTYPWGVKRVVVYGDLVPLEPETP